MGKIKKKNYNSKYSKWPNSWIHKNLVTCKLINLKNIFKNFLWKKTIDFFIAYYIFYEGGIQIFLKWSINKCLYWKMLLTLSKQYHFTFF